MFLGRGKLRMAWADLVVGDFKTGELDGVLTKCKFIRVECYAILSACVEPVYCLEEAFFNGICPEKCVVNTFRFVWYVRDDFIQAPGEAITGGNIALWGGLIPISFPWGKGWCSDGHRDGERRCGSHSNSRKWSSCCGAQMCVIGLAGCV